MDLNYSIKMFHVIVIDINIVVFMKGCAMTSLYFIYEGIKRENSIFIIVY